MALPWCGAGGPGAAPPVCADDLPLRLAWVGGNGVENGGDLYGLGPEGDERRLTEDGGAYEPAFSPDGRTIAFASTSGASNVSDTSGPEVLDLFVMGADGGGRRQLIDGGADTEPAWSPDGERIAFSRQVDGEPEALFARQLFVVDATGGVPTALLAQPNDGGDTQPAWSPDGEQVAFVRVVGIDDARVMVVDADGTGERRLAAGDVRHVGWSPDGRTIVVGERDGVIGLVDVATGSVRQLPWRGEAPAWSADGARLYAYATSPAVLDRGGSPVLTERPLDADVGLAVPGATPIAYVYNGYGIAPLTCMGLASTPLTEPGDEPPSETVVDPTTGESVQVLPRQEAIARVRRSLDADPADIDVEAKLVEQAQLANDTSGLGTSREADALLWLVLVRFPPEPDGEGAPAHRLTAIHARTGLGASESMGEGEEPRYWVQLQDRFTG